MKFKHKITAGLGVLALLASATLPALAAETAGVTATVTVQNIAISVSDGTVAYGTLGVNTSEDTTSSGVNNSQTATNDGNVNADFNIKGSNSANWTLAGTTGVADEYVHEFCRNDTGDCDGTPIFTALTTNYAVLDTTVVANDTQVFDLKITTPTSSSNFDQQNVNVTVQVVAS